MAAASPAAAPATAKPWRKDDGAHAIAVKRRDSDSFKTMSTGSLVSNSPFARRLGQIGHAGPSNATSPARSPPTTVRAPSPVERRSSGGSSKRQTTPRKTSAEEGPVKENESPHDNTNPLQRKASIEQQARPVPFRPTRGHAASSSLGNASMMAAELGLPFQQQPAQHSRPISMPPLASYARTDSDSPLGLGSRPQTYSFLDRPMPGMSDELCLTPPTGSPLSALSPSRLAASPRSIMVDDSHDGSPRRTLRHKASTKTVTWAATEEVLEYEPDEGRRASNISEASTQSAQTDDSAEDAERSITFDEGDSGFTEGGSIEVHDWPRRGSTFHQPDQEDEEEETRDEPESHMLAGGPSVEDMMSEIEDYMSRDMLSPAIPQASNETWGMAAAEAYRDTSKPVSRFFPPRSMAATSTQPRFVADDDMMSMSSYNDDESSPRPDAVPNVHRALPTPPASLAPAFSPKQHTQFALPLLPDNSPLMKILDDGTASSVVTIDLNEPASPRLGLTVTPGSHGLSRQASLIGSEVSTSSTGSLRNSRLLLQRARLEEALRQQDAMMTPVSSVLSPDLRRFPDPPKDRHPLRTSLTDELRSSAQKVRSHLETVSRSPSSQTITAESAREIQARPALRPRGATISDQMLPSLTTDTADKVVGQPLTSDMAESLQSPLERLSASTQLELKNSGAAAAAKSPSIGSSSMLTTPSASSHATRRRSLSTSDAGIAETTSKPHVIRKPVPSSEPASHLDVPISISQKDLELNLEKTFDHIFENSDRPYRLRETREVVYAYDGEVPTLRATNDIKGSGWHKKRRPSDLRLSVLGSSDAPDSTDRYAGRVFVTLIEARFDQLQLASKVTKGECFISCGGTSIRAGSFAVASSIPIKKEFELVVRENLSFTVQIRVPIDSNTNTHLLPPTPSPPASPTKRMFKTVFSSPKKKTASPRQPPVPERLLQNLATDGSLASVDITWKNVIPAEPCVVRRLEQPFSTGSNAPQPVSGTLVFELYHIPVIQGLPKTAYPLSVAEAKAGFALAQQQSVLHHEGVLTQMGGDCTTWRRRFFKLMGNRLVPYSEVTRKAHVEIELALAESVDDPDEKANDPSSPIKRSASQEMEESLWRVENMFTIVFKDGSYINFYSDRPEDKKDWLEHLRKVVNVANGLKAEPEWAKMLLKQIQAQPKS